MSINIEEDFPGMAQEMCLSDRERIDQHLEDIDKSLVDLLKRLERVERAIWG